MSPQIQNITARVCLSCTATTPSVNPCILTKTIVSAFRVSQELHQYTRKKNVHGEYVGEEYVEECGRIWGGICDFAGWAELTLHYSIKAERNSAALIFRGR